MLLIASILVAHAAALHQLDDTNFQKVTLIAKHIPVDNWLIEFCSGPCHQNLERAELPEDFKAGRADLSENAWLREHFKPGLWAFYTNSSMCAVQALSPQVTCTQHAVIPQIYKYPEYHFFSLKLIVVHIGLVLLVVFIYLVYRDLKAHFGQKKEKQN